MKTVNPEPTRLSREDDLNFDPNEASVPNPADKDIVRISREREMPLPVALAHQSHEMPPNAFRGFGINE